MSSVHPSSSGKPAPASHFGGGKGGKGGQMGKGGAKRHRKVGKDPIMGITNPAIRRILRRAGVKRMSGMIYEEVRGILYEWLTNVIQDALIYTLHSRRKTVQVMDMVYALKRHNHILYGYNSNKEKVKKK